MASQVTNYKCPACTGPMHYVGASGKLECDYCGSSFDVEQIEAMMAEDEKSAQDEFAANEAKSDDEKELDNWGVEAGMKSYTCPSCGAELICDDTTAATSCPYCGNPTVVPGQFKGALKPDYIIPFVLDEKQAKEALKQHYKGKKLLPDSFISGNRINEIKGVYVPFWLYDASADAQGEYEAKIVEKHRKGDLEITETKHFNVRRAGYANFTKVPVDGSSKMPDAHMDAIEPYDFSGLKDFSSAYLPGFLAEKYDEDDNVCKDRAIERIKNSCIELMKRDVKGYTSVNTMSAHVDTKLDKAKYALMPVYLLSTKWNGETFLFAMNGQTGKMIGDLPVDSKKYWTYFAKYTVILTVIIGIILNLVS